LTNDVEAGEPQKLEPLRTDLFRVSITVRLAASTCNSHHHDLMLARSISVKVGRRLLPGTDAGLHTAMNRQRNRRPRGGRDDTTNNSNVPTVQQVLPGASVSIVLKADQRTGREVQGVVQDLLTRGNHPRGIKVRLQDGRIGRVQSMAGNASPTSVGQSTPTAERLHVNKPAQRSSEVAGDYASALPQRSLADFLPASNVEGPSMNRSTDPPTFTTATARCPICGLFEGDEAAVSHHVEEHLK